MNRRGATLIESLVATIVLVVVLLGLASQFINVTLSRDAIMGGNNATTAGRQPIDIVADHIRNAQQYTTDNITYSVIDAATATSVTYYKDSAGATVSYYLENGDLKSNDGGTVATVLSGLTSLNLKYYLAATTSTYYSTSLTEGDPATFGLPERARVAAIQITGSMTVDGNPRTFSTMVRLRNSPRKVRL